MIGSEATCQAEDRLAPDAALARDGLPSEDFKAAFRNHAAGVALVTADPGDGPAAMTATSVFSVSATPPLLVFSVSDLSSAAPTILRADSVVVHLLDAEQIDLAMLGATSGIDRFADLSIWMRLETGEPVFTAADIWIRGAVVNRFTAGSSTLVVVNATAVSLASGADQGGTRRPLVYHNRIWHGLGEHSRIG